MVIEFDPAKDAANQKKHGVSLELAADFDLRRVLTHPGSSAQGEARTQVIGDIGGTVYTAIVTERGGTLRIISVRRASRKERQQYERTIRHTG